MFTKKLILWMGLSMLLVGCSTGRSVETAMPQNVSTSEMGMRYLLGRGVPQDDAKAFSYFNQAAKEDDAFAQNELGYLYAAGKGTSQDYAKSFANYEKAANHGLASAQYNLGLLYLNGLGTAPNKTLAMQWFSKAAAKGFEPAKQALIKYRE